MESIDFIRTNMPPIDNSSFLEEYMKLEIDIMSLRGNIFSKTFEIFDDNYIFITYFNQ